LSQLFTKKKPDAVDSKDFKKRGERASHRAKHQQNKGLDHQYCGHVDLRFIFLKE
jgi:hypothetical protein